MGLGRLFQRTTERHLGSLHLRTWIRFGSEVNPFSSSSTLTEGYKDFAFFA